MTLSRSTAPFPISNVILFLYRMPPYTLTQALLLSLFGELLLLDLTTARRARGEPSPSNTGEKWKLLASKLSKANSAPPPEVVRKRFAVSLRCLVVRNESPGDVDEGAKCLSPVFEMASANESAFAAYVGQLGKRIYQTEGINPSDASSPSARRTCASMTPVSSCAEAMSVHGAGKATCQNFCVSGGMLGRSYPCRWSVRKGSSLPNCHSGEGNDTSDLRTSCNYWDTCGGDGNDVTLASSGDPTDESDLAALWKVCRTAQTASPGTGPCCPEGKACAASVMEVSDLSNSDANMSGVPIPLEGAAALMPFIYQARHENLRLLFSPHSRRTPREEPVVEACDTWVERLRATILRRGLPLLMRWGPDGYFDVYRKFDSSHRYGPSLLAPVLSVLLNQHVTDAHTAEEIWREWIDAGDEDQASRLLKDGSDEDDWWNKELSEILSDAYYVLQELESDVATQQHSAMNRGVKVRNGQVSVRRFQFGAMVFLGGVTLTAAAAPASAAVASIAAVVNTGWLGGVRPAVVHWKGNQADEVKLAADQFGRTHKKLQWLAYHREWIERWLEVNLTEAFAFSRPHVKIREEVKQQLFCDGNKQKGSASAPAENCFATEQEFKATLLASWVNLIMIDGGCVIEPDFKPFTNPPTTAFGVADHVACCAKDPGPTWGAVKGQCAVRSTRGEGQGGLDVCPDGWRRVSRDWAFVEPGDQQDAPTCCGALQDVGRGEFECGVTQCFTKHHASTEELEIQAAFTDIPEGQRGLGGLCRRRGFRREDALRETYCNAKESETSQIRCGDAQAIALCKSRRDFCSFFARSKHEEWYKTYSKVTRSIERCIQELAEMSATFEYSDPI